MAVSPQLTHKRTHMHHGLRKYLDSAWQTGASKTEKAQDMCLRMNRGDMSDRHQRSRRRVSMAIILLSPAGYKATTDGAGLHVGLLGEGSPL